MKAKHKRAVEQVVAKLDEFIRQTLVSKGRNGRRQWCTSNDLNENGICLFKVYVRLPIGAVIREIDAKDTRVTNQYGDNWNVLDIASVEANPCKQGMGTYFFNLIEEVALGRGLEFIRVESVLNSHVATIIKRKEYVGDEGGNYHKRIR
mgnify:CR=1 FL=1